MTQLFSLQFRTHTRHTRWSPTVQIRLRFSDKLDEGPNLKKKYSVTFLPYWPSSCYYLRLRLCPEVAIGPAAAFFLISSLSRPASCNIFSTSFNIGLYSSVIIANERLNVVSPGRINTHCILFLPKQRHLVVMTCLDPRSFQRPSETSTLLLRIISQRYTISASK